jgi:hypothetical protein
MVCIIPQSIPWHWLILVPRSAALPLCPIMLPWFIIFPWPIICPAMGSINEIASNPIHANIETDIAILNLVIFILPYRYILIS